ncbi:MAG TPA: multicopper oxidase domain-containing protein [Myxococcales bacterium]
MPLPIPVTLTPTTTATTDSYSITVKPGTTQMKATGAATPIVGFNGTFPGPTIVATKGRTVQVTQTNGWTENITIHNHGHKVAASSDGHPTDYIVPGASKTYTYTNDQRAGTYWYHDHTMDLTGAHVYNGLAAFYIIHDPAEDSLGLPSGSYDVPLLLQDKQFNADNTLAYDSNNNIRHGFLGDTAVVNGAVTPYLNVSTHKYRFRVLNGSNARNFTIQLASGASFRVIGSDGGLLAAPVTLTSLNVAPAERYDLIIDFSGAAVGSSDVLTNTDRDNPSIGDLVQFRVTTATADTSTVPATLSTITRYTSSQAVSTVPLTFSQGNQDWTINGLLYDPARLDVFSTLNTIYIWELNNQSGEMHPFHKHLTEFQVLDINGSPPPPEQMGWKDTVAVPSWGSAHVIFKDETFPGTFVFHCHKLEHEDHRMMLQESVTQ